jgi:predicted regulator of Ras-like GTPase activity (Roadblock/LC7/MglB family)
MMDDKTSNLEKVLRKLLKYPEIMHASIVTVEGLPIVAILPRGMEELKMAAITATFLSLAERSIVEMRNGKFNYLVINGMKGTVFIFQAGRNAVLTISTKKDAKIGLILLEAQKAIDRIRELI